MSNAIKRRAISQVKIHPSVNNFSLPSRSGDFDSYNKTFREVSRNSPCSACGKPDWCHVLLDSSGSICLTVCNREVSAHPANGGTGYIHYQPGYKNTPSINSHIGMRHHVDKDSLAIISQTAHRKAKADSLHKVYKILLKHMPLTHKHRKNLNGRGLNRKALLKYPNSFASWDGDYKKVRSFVNEAKSYWSIEFLLTIPGFGLNTKNGKLQFCLNSYNQGILLAVKDEESRIVGVQIRLDDESNGKTRWVSGRSHRSGSKRPISSGVSSGTPIHLVKEVFKSDSAEPSEYCYLTEGQIKATVTNHFTGIATIGLPGVFASSDRILLRAIKSTGADTVTIAFDSDWETNSTVRSNMHKIANQVCSLGFAAEIASWDGKLGKGIDDLLNNGHGDKIKRTPYRQTIDISRLRIDKDNLELQHSSNTKGDDDKQGSATFTSIDEAREALSVALDNATASPCNGETGKTTLLRVTPGVGKTKSAIDIAIEQEKNGKNVAYLTVRNTLIDDRLEEMRQKNPNTTAHKHIARNNKTELLDVMTAEDLREYNERAVRHEDLENLIGCFHIEKADSYAKSGRNVAEELCAGCPDKDICGKEIMKGREGLKVAVTTHLQTKYGAKVIYKGRDTIFIDEVPTNLCKKTISINRKDVIQSKVNTEDEIIINFLDHTINALEDAVVAEKKKGEGKDILIGTELLPYIEERAGGTEKLQEMTNYMINEDLLLQDTVEVTVDKYWGIAKNTEGHPHRITHKGKAIYIDQDDAELRGEKTFRLRESLAIDKGLSEEQCYEPSLNFLPTLVNELFPLLSGKRPNSGLVFDLQKSEIRCSTITPLDFDEKTNIVILDAYGDPLFLEQVLGRKVDVVDIDCHNTTTSITGILDGKYGISSIYNDSEKGLSRTGKRINDKVTIPVLQRHGTDNSIIITHKKVADHQRSNAKELGIEGASIAHYGGVTGSNEYIGKEALLLQGNFAVSPTALRETCHSTYANDPEPLSFDTIEVKKKSNYTASDGTQVLIKTREYSDKRVEAMNNHMSVGEMMQSLHRTRLVSNDNLHIYVCSNIPLDIPYTSLLTIDQFEKQMKAKAMDVEEEVIETFRGNERVSDYFVYETIMDLIEERSYATINSVLHEIWTKLKKITFYRGTNKDYISATVKRQFGALEENIKKKILSLQNSSDRPVPKYLKIPETLEDKYRRCVMATEKRVRTLLRTLVQKSPSITLTKNVKLEKDNSKVTGHVYSIAGELDLATVQRDYAIYKGRETEYKVIDIAFAGAPWSEEDYLVMGYLPPTKKWEKQEKSPTTQQNGVIWGNPPPPDVLIANFG